MKPFGFSEAGETFLAGNPLDKFDLIVIGSGAGLHVASQAVEEGWRVALIDQGPPGGTCLNNGCIPSKMLIHSADVVRILQDARSVGVEARVERLDFSKIMNRMHSVVDKTRNELMEAIGAKKDLTWYGERAEFIGDYLLKVGGKTLTASKIVIASGARPFVPPIRGLKTTGYLDNISLLMLQDPPKSLIIIGAGYIGCEYGHFFSAMGTDVTILGRSPRVLDNEDPEVCRIIRDAFSQQMHVITSHEAIEVEQKNGKKVVSARRLADGKILQFEADEILLAAGRMPNSDLLKPEKTGVEMDKHGWIKVNDYLETTKKDIWAIGDAIGKYMFRHTANYESDVVSHNLLREDQGEKEKVDFHAVPYAVFTHPSVAGVGLKEAEALAAGRKVLVGRAKYTDVAMGIVMVEDRGFVKVVLEEETGRILGASIVGSMAPELVQQVVYLMNTDDQDLRPVIRSQVIHPTINEVLVRAFSELEHPYHHEEKGQ